MRNFLQSSAGGTFPAGSNATFVQRKDGVEIVFKMKGGLYGVVHAFMTGTETLSLATVWGECLRTFLQCEHPEKIIEQLRQPCPLFFKLATEKGDYNLIRIPDAGDVILDGIATNCQVPPEGILMHVATAPDVIHKAFELFSYSVNVYSELVNNCPVEEWKAALRKM